MKHFKTWDVNVYIHIYIHTYIHTYTIQSWKRLCGTHKYHRWRWYSQELVNAYMCTYIHTYIYKQGGSSVQGTHKDDRWRWYPQELHSCVWQGQKSILCMYVYIIYIFMQYITKTRWLHGQEIRLGSHSSMCVWERVDVFTHVLICCCVQIQAHPSASKSAIITHTYAFTHDGLTHTFVHRCTKKFESKGEGGGGRSTKFISHLHMRSLIMYWHTPLCAGVQKSWGQGQRRWGEGLQSSCDG